MPRSVALMEPHRCIGHLPNASGDASRSRDVPAVCSIRQAVIHGDGFPLGLPDGPDDQGQADHDGQTRVASMGTYSSVLASSNPALFEAVFTVSTTCFRRPA